MINFVEYTVSDGKVTITKYRGTDTDVIIPSEIEGMPVTSIGERAFLGCSGLTSVTIPDSVTSIGTFAFNGCSSLTSIEIPDSVTSIESWAFYDCSKLKDVWYSGTAEQWRKIKIAIESFALDNAKKHFKNAI